MRSESTEAYVPMTQDVVHISGYLHKRTRDMRWQKRWFETNGCFLTYYKSRKMTKLLAALNLPQVGAIKLLEDSADDPDNDGTLFTIELRARVYTLKAASKEEAMRWVDVLNQLKSGANSEVAQIPGAKGVDAGFDNANEGNGDWFKFRLLCCC